MVKRSTHLAYIALILLATVAQAQTVKIGCTATPDCAAAMIAVDDGVFKRYGIEAEMVAITINSNIPAALLSNSIQIGGPTPSVLLQAVDQGVQRTQVGDHLELAVQWLGHAGEHLDLLAEELRLAQQALGEITGEFSADDLLGEIFSRFCIGK